MNNKKTIILISGKHGSGKTTLGNNLANELMAPHLTFAKEVYRVHDKILELLDIDNVTKDRKLLQAIGTWARDNYGKDFWTRIVAKKIREISSEVQIISDWRYEDEYLNLRNFFPNDNFILIRLYKERSSSDTHSSEIDLDYFLDFDIEINTSKYNPAETLCLVLDYIRS